MSVDDELLLGIARQLASKPDGKQAGWQASSNRGTVSGLWLLPV